MEAHTKFGNQRDKISDLLERWDAENHSLRIKQGVRHVQATAETIGFVEVITHPRRGVDAEAVNVAGEGREKDAGSVDGGAREELEEGGMLWAARSVSGGGPRSGSAMVVLAVADRVSCGGFCVVMPMVVVEMMLRWIRCPILRLH